MYGTAQDTLLAGAARETFEAVALLKSIDQQPHELAPGVNYPAGRLAASLRQIAQLIKADVGVEVAFADIGGWDHHVNEVGARPSQGQLANLLRGFSR